VLSITTRRMKVRKGSITDVVVTDETGNRISSMNLTFFNALHASRQLHQGELAIFSGKVTEYNGKYSLTNPEFSVLAPEAGESAEAAAARPIPIYPATAKLRSWEIQAAVAALLPVVALDDLADPVPEAILRRERLSSLADAYRAIHAPGSEAEWRRAQDRFRYQEALVLQSALARRRAQAAAERATARPGRTGGLLDRFDAALPFTLTAGQQDVGATLSAEVASGQPMNRLLQGEVGSGKTVVALRAMLQVIDSGGQAALLAPTEVLAAQHYESIRAILGPLAEGGMLGGADDGTRVALLTGSQGAAARKKALLDAASGEAGIVVGTHALLSETVQFFDLGLIVVDEQHRFGVEQRDVLRTKAARPPHLLVMTATPIPRTVAMTVFGDLETSVLRELPAGRAPISTHVVGLAENPGWVRRIWSRAREEIDAGHQVYVVCPRIGDGGSDAQDGPDRYDAPEDAAGVEPVSVTELLEQLQDEPALAGTRVEMLHGRMDPAEKSAAMARFAAGEIDVLVSTTVIEVGVDVHNATLMVIMGADRFGISQLHQLRGRVGRGGLPGTALLVTALEREQPGRSRLAAVAATTDGFRLAEEDLRFRREGDVLGASQSGGRSTLRLLRVLRDADIIGRAREDAAAMVARDADLSGHPALVGAIDLYLNPEKEVFLERG
jgi:ATP-dependent DNA helicase RecG